MPALAQRLRRACSAETGLRRAARVNAHQLSTSVFSFVGEFGDERRPSGIIDTLGKPSTSQAFKVQIFDGNRAVAVDDATTNLVLKVRTLIKDVLVCALQKLHGFPATVRAFLASRYFALCNSQLLLRFPVVARIINLSSIRECGEREQANIYADALCPNRQRLCLHFNRKARIPPPCFTLDRQGLDLSFNLTMQLDFDLADFRQAEMRTLQRESELRIGERVITGARTKARESGFAPALHSSKERFESLINSMQGVLQDLRMDAVEIRSELLDLDKLRALSGEVNAFTVDAPRIASFLQRCVIEFTATCKRAIQQSYLLLRGKNPKLVGEPARHLSDSQRTALSLTKVRSRPYSQNNCSSTTSGVVISNKETLAATGETKRLSDSSPNGKTDWIGHQLALRLLRVRQKSVAPCVYDIPYERRST